MTTTVFLALDTFFHNWESDNRQAWLGIQPYINGSPQDVADWVNSGDNILTGSDSIFKIAGPDDITSQAIPVPLPGQLTVSVQLFNEKKELLKEVTIKRGSHCLVSNAERFRQLNQFSTLRNLSSTIAGNSKDKMAYPVLFTSTLKQSLQPQNSADAPAPISVEQLAENLQLKFELGQRQKFDEECLIEVGDYFDASHEHDQDFAQVTNTHYLLGQLLNLGNDLKVLSKVSFFKILIDQKELSMPDDGGATARIFSSISDEYKWDDFEQKLKWMDLSQRINAKAQGDTFTVKKLGGLNSYLWRLSSKDVTTSNSEMAGNNVRWNAFERLDIREKSDVAESLLTHPRYQRINFTPALVLDVELVRFRKTPEVLPASAELPPAQQDDQNEQYQISSMLVAMQPTAAEKTRFDNLLMHHRNLLTNAMLMVQDAQLTDDNGQNITANYQITPELHGVYDFPWEANSQCLWFFKTGVGEATQDFPDNVSFDFNKHVYQKVQLVIPLNHTLELNRLGMVEMPPNSGNLVANRYDPFGPRWEFWRTPDNQATHRGYGPDFNALLCPQLDDDPIDLDQLIVTAFHNDKYDYELAQSARRLETVVQVHFENIRETDPHDLTSFDFQQTVIEDKTNHNQLNLFEWRSDYTLTEDGLDSDKHIEHRNNGSALPCIKLAEENTRDPLKKNLYYCFMGVMKDSTSAPTAASDNYMLNQVENQLGRDNFSTREFYVDVYNNLGTGRAVSVNLEHTYGSTILDTDIDDIPNPIDEPILLASDVAFSLNAQGQQPQKLNLFEVSLTKESGIEMLTLHFNQELLDEQWIQQRTGNTEAEQRQEANARALAHVQAWQAFAELHFAKNITVMAECYDFDIHQYSANNTAPALQQGLVHQLIPLEELSEKLRKLVKQAFVSFKDLPKSISVPTEGQWGEDFHAVRIRLDVTRQQHVVPDLDENWEVHRRLARMETDNVEDLYTFEGVKTQRIDLDVVDAQVNNFLTRLKSRGGYITPRDLTANKHRNEQFFALLGEGTRFDHVAASSNSWIVPTDLKRDNEEDKIEVAYCPVGITPIAADPRLKRDTTPVVKHYFTALQAVVDCEPYEWFSGDAANLKRHIDRLVEKDVVPRYRKLIKQAERKFKAIPDPSVDETRLQAPVRQLADKLNRDHDPVKAALTEKVTTLLSQQPGLFGTLKGLSVTNVTGTQSRNGYKIRPDFFNLHHQKTVNAQLQTSSQLGAAQLLHASRSNFTYWEQLDDSQFDNKFTLTAVRGETAERLFEQQPAGTDNSDYHVNVQDGKVFIPDNAPKHIGEAEVRLTSRRPVQNPVLGAVKQTSVAAHVREGLDVNSPLNLPDMLSAKLVKATQASSKTMNAQISHQAAFSGNLDKVTVTAAFRIKGDEEIASAGVSDKFANDAFFVLVTDEPQHEQMPAFDPMVHSHLTDIADLPTNPRPLALQTGLADKVLGDATMRACTNILGRESSLRSLPARKHIHKAFCIRQNEAQQKLEVVDKSRQLANPARFDCNVWLFQNADQDTVVWLEVELPIWEKRYISLVQTRNQAGVGDTQQQIFAPEFATISQTVGGPTDRMTNYEQLRNEFNDENSGYPPVVVDGSSKTPLAFLRAVLGNRMDGLDEDFAGRKNHLNITIKEDSSSAFPTHQGANQKLKVYNGSFARFTHRVAADEQGKSENWSERQLNWFGSVRNAGQWRIDFEWRDPETNDEILRIEDFPVTFNP